MRDVFDVREETGLRYTSVKPTGSLEARVFQRAVHCVQ